MSEWGEKPLGLDARARAEPLLVARAKAAARAERVGVVDKTFERDRERLDAAVRVLREARDVRAMVHPIGPRPVEVCAIAHARRVHVRGLARGIVVDVCLDFAR